MTRLSDRLRDAFGRSSDDHGWCQTTDLANPWSVLLGGTRPPTHPPADDAEPAAGGPRSGTPPTTDLRDAVPGPESKGGA